MAPITDDLHEYEKLEREKAAVAADKAKLAQEREEMQKRQEELEKKMERLLSGGLNPMGMMGGMGMQDPMMMGMMNPMMMGMMNPMMMNPMMNPMMMGSMGGFNPMMNPMGMMNQMGNMGQGGMNPMMMGGMNPMMMGGMNPMMGQGMNPMMNAAQGGMGPGCPSINGMSGNGMYGVAGNSMHGGVAPSAAMNGTAWTVGQSDSKATTKKHKDTKTTPTVEGSSASASVTPSMKELMERKKAAEAETKSATSKATAQRQKTDAVRQKFLNTDRGVDLLFIVDVTGSMAAWIAAVRAKIDLIIKEQEAMAPGRPLRVGFLGYRDHCDSDRFEIVHFVTAADVQEFKNKVQAIKASGGGDTPEDIAGALNRVHQFEWRSRTKLIIHIADAPCHGKKYHEGLGDSYPNGDPEGLVPEELLVSLCSENKIDFYFVKINASTDKMTGIFEQALSACDGVNFKCHELGSDPKELVKAVMESLSMSMGSAGGAAAAASKADSAVASLTRGLRTKGDTVTESSWTKL